MLRAALQAALPTHLHRGVAMLRTQSVDELVQLCGITQVVVGRVEE